MPKIIVTSRYIKPNAHKKFGNYIKYIATRKGVEKPIPKQDNKQLDREIFMNYLDSRPNSHGLFSEKDEPIVLDKIAKEVANHSGAIWTHIVSLKREDAERMRRVFAYLTKQRFIAPDVISFFAHQHKIYEDKEHHNAVFVGTDENGVPRQASLRSTISFGNAFRLTVSGSDTKYSFSHFGNSGKLFVFEAPIDMLSFITLYQKDWKDHSYIAMNGVYESAVLEALKCHSNLGEIVLCTDNDSGGIDAAERLKDILSENGHANIFRITPRNKDFNEDLKELHGLSPIPASVHLRKELFSENVSQLEFEPINLNRIADSLNAALNRNKYTYVSNIALSASAEILAKINEKPAEDMFENLRKHLLKEYRAYSDRGKIFSKIDTLKKSHFEAIKQLKNYPATKEQMKNIAKSLFDLADSALKCSTEQQMSERQEQEESPQQNVEIKMSM